MATAGNATATPANAGSTPANATSAPATPAKKYVLPHLRKKEKATGEVMPSDFMGSRKDTTAKGHLKEAGCELKGAFCYYIAADSHPHVHMGFGGGGAWMVYSESAQHMGIPAVDMYRNKALTSEYTTSLEKLKKVHGDKFKESVVHKAVGILKQYDGVKEEGKETPKEGTKP